MKSIKEISPEILDFTKSLIGIPTENPPGMNYKECIHLIERKLHIFDLETEMMEDDIKFATKLTLYEKWGYKEKDLRRLIYFEPEGCFIAWKNEERVGMVTTTSYGDYAFLGCLIVRKEERGGELGTKLMEHAINVLKKKGVKTIELDGVFPAVSLYRRLKLKDKYLSLRFMRKATGGNVKRATQNINIAKNYYLK